MAEWKPDLRKRKPAQLLASASKGRVKALLDIKRERMVASPFGFFRGSAAVMAYDLSLMPHTKLYTQLCGDAHVQNLGAYAGPDGRLIFNINDFDETIRGPFEWDVKRMTTSILLAAEEAEMKAAAGHSAAAAFLTAYCTLIEQLSHLPVLEVARFQVHRLAGVHPIAEIFEEAQRATPLHSLEQLTENSGDGRIFRSRPPLLRRVLGAEAREVLASLKKYVRSLLPERQHFLQQFKPIDVAFKVVGTGSVGLRDYCVYLEGNGPNDPLFLQIKQEAESAYCPYLTPEKSASASQGQRVADGERAMQVQSDPLLGWTMMGGRSYLVRQLNDHKATLNVTTLKPQSLCAYATVCGEMLARGHARAGDARMLAGYVGNGGRFKESVLEFAEAYAKQTEVDWKAFRGKKRKKGD